MAPGVHSRRAPRLPASFAFDEPLPTTRSFRPRGFSPPRRLPPPAACGLVASHYRPWGSPGFRVRRSIACMAARVLPHRCPALQSFPRPHSRTCISTGRCPLAVLSCVPGANQGSSTSRRCSVRASVVVVCRCRPPTPVALLGFPVLEHHNRRPRSPPPTEADDRSPQPPFSEETSGPGCIPIRSRRPEGRRCADGSRAQGGGTPCIAPTEVVAPPLQGSSRPTQR